MQGLATISLFELLATIADSVEMLTVLKPFLPLPIMVIVGRSSSGASGGRNSGW